MNERIRALAEQAGYKHPDAVGMCEDYAYFSHEKFAELIVRECITVINQPNGVGDDDVIRITKDVEKHFGVEE